MEDSFIAGEKALTKVILMKRRNFIDLSAKGILPLAMAPSFLKYSVPTQDIAFIDRILPAPKNGGFSDPDYWIWGSSVIKGEDGKYHMFASRWTKQVGFGNWVTNSKVVHAIADTAIGPYQFHDVALPVRGKQY